MLREHGGTQFSEKCWQRRRATILVYPKNTATPPKNVYGNSATAAEKTKKFQWAASATNAIPY